MRLLQTATLLAIGIFALGCTREAGYYVERGNEFFDEGAYKDAALQYQKAIQQDPQLGEAYYRLALTEIEQGNAQEALAAMRRAADLAPELIDARVKLAEMSLAVYAGYPAGNKAMYELAKKIADDFLREDSSSYEGLVLSGQLALLDRNPDAAATFFADAARSDASRPQAVGLHVQAVADAGRVEEAFELGETALQDHADFGPIYDVLYRLYINANRISDGQRVLQAKVDNNPNELEFRLQLAEHWARAGNRDAMESTLKQILDQPEAFPSARMAIGDFLMRSGGFEEAIRAYREGAEEEPEKEAQYLVRIAQVQRRQGNSEAAIQTAREAIAIGASDPEPSLVLADLVAERGQPGDIEEAVESYQKAKEAGDSAPETDLKMARAHLSLGDREAARSSLQEAVGKGSLLLEPRILLGALALQERNPSQALSSLDAALQIDPDDRRSLLLRVVALLDLSRTAEARQTVQSLVRRFPNDPEVRFQEALLALQEGRYAEAESLLQKLQSSGVGGTKATVALSEVYLRSQQNERAVALIRARLEDAPDSARLRRLLADTLVRAGELDEAVKELGALVDASPDSAELRGRLGDVYRLQGKTQAAIEEMRRAVELAPQEPGARLALASLLEADGRPEEALEAYRRAVELQPNNGFAKNNLAYLLAAQGQLDEALELAESAALALPDHPSIQDTLGWIYHKKGMQQSAEQILSRVARDNPDVATFRYHLGAVLAAAGNKVAARAELEAALAGNLAPSARDECVRLLETI